MDGKNMEAGFIEKLNKNNELKKKENWFLKIIYKPNPWIVRIVGTLIAAGILSGISLLYSIFKGIPWINVLNSILDFIIMILTFEIPAWILIILLIIIIFILFRRRKEKVNPTEKELLAARNEWSNYTKDEIKGKIVTWSYGYKKSEDKYYIVNLLFLCINCDCRLRIKQLNAITSILQCPNCEKQFPFVSPDDVQDIKTIIIHRIDSGEYKSRPLYNNR